jgi:hypothetical protein
MSVPKPLADAFNLKNKVEVSITKVGGASSALNIRLTLVDG